MINLKRASKKMSSAGEKNFSKTGRRTNCVFIPKKTYIRKFTLYGNNLGECNTNDLNKHFSHDQGNSAYSFKINP